MRGIIFIVLLTVLITAFAYNNLPEWVYYLTPATRLWIASEELGAAYEEDFLSKIKDVEKEYDTSVEVFRADGALAYSTKALITYLPADVNTAEALDDIYLFDYEVTNGERRVGEKSFLIKKYDTGSLSVTFIDCYKYLDSGVCIDVYMQVSQISTNIKISFILSFVAIMFSMVIALMAIWFYIKRFTNPVNKMVQVTQKMAKLDFSQNCPPSTLSELNSLATGINEMSAALDTALTDLKNKNQKLEEDIENERTIDNLRQTFIGGISHELKTPIAIIQGYAEGAKMFYSSGQSEAADKYCDVIIGETQRMNSMIMRLLEITKYSSGAYELQREDFALRPFVQDWIDRNTGLLEEKGIVCENAVPEEISGSGDEVILSSVLNNYLSNAVSHCEGEKKIRVTCAETEAAFRIRIYNTGQPIAPKDIDKIWDSFYRADKALSRSQGRFGLGLSIVSAIQKLHGEAFGVENKEDGVEFWFDVKKSSSAGVLRAETKKETQ